jgi:hypothetical protein
MDRTVRAAQAQRQVNPADLEQDGNAGVVRCVQAREQERCKKRVQNGRLIRGIHCMPQSAC